MIVSLLLAADENNLIGKNNALPWNLPNDLKYFKNLTWAMPIVMGRKTFESLGKPLPGRTNIVITRNKKFAAPGAYVVQSLEQAIARAELEAVNEIFIIGGAEIFHAALGQAGRIYLTRIHAVFDGDVYFKELMPKDWTLVKKTFCAADEKNKWDHTFQVWERVPADRAPKADGELVENN